MKRCVWATGDELYLTYHDTEWGVPVYDDRKLFEMFILEGAQAGLSWLTVLRRRENYRKAFDGFAPHTMAYWDRERIETLRHNPGIIRNRLKIEGARSNARAFLKVVAEYGSFSDFIWSFVNGRTIQNSWKNVQDIPQTTPESDRMSKELKRRGFKFAGPTICYAFMQAVGLVNDHTVDCFRHKELVR